MNRLDDLEYEMTKNPERNMDLLLKRLSVPITVPRQDKYYVFRYEAKTRGIVYDTNPFIVCLNVFSWGVLGYNFHWETFRQYTWNEFRTRLYQIYDDELDLVSKLPIANFKRT